MFRFAFSAFATQSPSSNCMFISVCHFVVALFAFLLLDLVSTVHWLERTSQICVEWDVKP